MDYYFRFGVVWANFDKLLQGLALGLTLALVAIAAGTIIGIVCAFAATGRSRATRVGVNAYVSIIRNTPILVIVLLVFFALPQLGIRLDKYQSFIASLAVYAGAYLTEVFRAGLSGVPRGVIDAGRAIGMTGVQVSTYVVFPIMLRNSLPAMGTTFISLFKDTSIATAIAVPELTFQARKINVETFRVVEVWLVASALYVSTCLVIAAGLRQLERRYSRL
ncbi:MAG TPA: amino acid ABC transporter permease [Aestuariivirgaceae bacterium]|nr:amino acid ABC transporter permease [Aestuariivirgaceae bacterium]